MWNQPLRRELRIAAAVKWYELGRVSQGRGAEIAGLSRMEFFDALSRYGVSPFQESMEDLAAMLKSKTREWNATGEPVGFSKAS